MRQSMWNTRFERPALESARRSRLNQAGPCPQRWGAITMKSFRLLFGISLVLMFCAAAWAQTGSITGTVKDPSGAAVSGAKVVVTSPERGITREMDTNASGDYKQSALPSGNSDIIMRAGCFKKFQTNA